MLQIMGLSTYPRESYTKYTKCIQVYLGVNTTQWKKFQAYPYKLQVYIVCLLFKFKINIPLAKLRITDCASKCSNYVYA